jgi:hypothetical protein
MGKIICFKSSIKNIKKPIPIIEMGFFIEMSVAFK